MITENDKLYLKGSQNRLIRYYFYVTKGLDILNLFRNLFLAIFAVYFALKLTNVMWLIAIFIPSIVGLAIAGYYSVHRMSTVMEWLGIRFGTHYATKNFDYVRKTYEEVENIRKILDKNKS